MLQLQLFVEVFTFYVDFIILPIWKPGKNTMNLSVKGASVGKKELGAEATLNPNAAEFVPFSLRSQAESIRIPDSSSKFATSGKSILDRSESSASNNSSSEEEAQQYWRHQLPDDITPDFKLGVDNEINSLSFSNLSLNEVRGASRYTSPTNSGFMSKELALHSVDGKSHAEKLRYLSLAKPWEKPIGSSDQLLARERNPYNGNSSRTFLAEMPNEEMLSENTDMCSLEFLASQFPDFAAETIAEVYFSNGGDLNLTIKKLTQLEIQVDGGLNQAFSPKAFSTPNRGALNLPSLRVPDGRIGFGKLAGNNQQNASPYWSSMKDSSLPFRSFSSVPSPRKTTSQDSSIWKYERNRSSDTRQVLASSFNRGPPLASPVRLGIGESFANVYSGNREEAREHARLHNSYVEQARQAYVAGNKTLAKELSILGQLCNFQVKAAHEKAQESIYRQRNLDIQTNGREQMIDLYGLNVNEAIFVLKRELAVLRNAARSVDRHLLVYVFVGVGHHTRGPTTPARIVAAVQRCLLEEGLDFSEPQPGLLRVMVY